MRRNRCWQLDGWRPQSSENTTKTSVDRRGSTSTGPAARSELLRRTPARDVRDGLVDQPQVGADRRLEVRLRRVFLLAVRQAVRRVREHHHDRHVRHHLRRVVQRTGRQPRRVAGFLAHRLLAQLDQPRDRTAAARFATTASTRPTTWFSFAQRSDASRASREHRREHVGIERPLIERDLADAGHRGDDFRLDVDDADGADDAGGRASNGAARSRGRRARSARRRETRRAASESASTRSAPPGRRTAACGVRRRRCRARRRSTCASTRAPAPARCAARDRRARRSPSARDAPRASRRRRRRSRASASDQPRALPVLQTRGCRRGRGCRAAADDPSRLRPKRAPSSSAQSTSLSVTGGGGRGVKPQRFERRQRRRARRRASRRWAPNRDGCRRSRSVAEAPGSVTQLLPAESVSMCRPSSATWSRTRRARRARSVPTRGAGRHRRSRCARRARADRR